MINFNQLIKEALKTQNSDKIKTYRNLKAEIQKYETSKNAESLTDAKQLEIISKYSKKLEDSISQFSEARRDDLVSEYTSELTIVKELLPEPINSQKLLLFIQEDNYFTKYQNDAEIKIPKKDMGSCIKYLKSEFPTADGKVISQIIKDYVI